MALNQGKLHKNRSWSGLKCCSGSIVMLGKVKSSGVLLIVLYCYKKRTKGVDREI